MNSPCNTKLQGQLVSTLALAALLASPGAARAADPAYWSWAKTPPMGWNSWDCYGAGVWESNVIANAEYMDKNLKSHGWNLITIDIQWYEPLAHTDRYRRGALVEMDANGRLLPAPNRFAMTVATHSFKPFADYLHAKGLKFGLHLMRGIPRQAVRDNVLILGTEKLKEGGIHAADIIFPNGANSCGWNTDMNGVDMSKPGAQEYYDSVFKLMASWDLDFVKVDDLAGKRPEIEGIRKAIDKCGRPILLSVSMGSQPNQGAHLATNANMWRVSFDFWDNWPSLYNQFANLDSHQPFQGPGHWPDADMIPFGHLQTWKVDPPHMTLFTRDEQYTVMSLWCIARSPLIMGAEMPDNDAFTLSLMTNDEVIAINQKSTNNKQVYSISNHIAWVADVPGSKDKYVGLFNASPAPVGGGRRGGRGGFGGRGGPGASGGTNVAAAPEAAPAPAPAPAPVDPAATLPAKISVSLADIGLSGACTVRDLWAKRDLGTVNGEVSATVNSHGAVLLRVHPEN
jgi:alpha-galactosidase